MIDILYVGFNRLEFTKATLAALVAATPEPHRLVIYDDGSTDGTKEFLEEQAEELGAHFHATEFGSPVAVMNDYLIRHDAPLFAKIDSDTLVPPGWLPACLQVMRDCPELDLLGIEAHCPVGAGPRHYRPTEYIGGIGLMRRRAFRDLPQPQGRFGFTSWQDKRPHIRKGWISPALTVALLDKMPMEPWLSLSAEYERRKWQRPWPKYEPGASALWDWWKP